MGALGEAGLVLGVALAFGLAWYARRRWKSAPALSDLPQVGRYRLIETLGEGGMSVVHRALGPDGSEVAVKVLPPDPDAPPTDEDLKRFRREVTITSRLQHPNIVRVLDFGEVDGQPYLVMESLPGPSLQTLRQEGPMALSRFLSLFTPVVDAVWYAHRQGVIHRDLKPANVLLRNDGRPVVVDFGISQSSRHRTKLTDTGWMVGTAMYLAPEQIADSRHSSLSDQYSLGVMAFELLGGQSPMAGLDTMALAYTRLVQSPPSIATCRADLPAPVVALVDRMMAFEASARYPDLGEVKAELLQIAG